MKLTGRNDISGTYYECRCISCGNWNGVSGTQMIHQSLTIFPITVLSVIGGVYVGYRLGTVHNSQAYLAGGALFLIAGVDVVIQYCMY